MTIVALILLFIAAPLHAAKTSIWLYDKDPRGLDSLRRYHALVDEVSPIWYAIGKDNHIVERQNVNAPEWRAAMAGIPVVPIIQNAFMGEFGIQQTHDLIMDVDGRERHAEEIVRLVIENGYDGIELDYEWMLAETRDYFTDFVALLAGKLHAHGRILSVTLHPKYRDRDDMGPGSQDWAGLARHADRLKIMAYNYSWPTSPPGPIAPVDWLEKIAVYAKDRIPAEKLYFGLPWYGYNWKEGEEQARAVYWTDVQQILATEKPTDLARDASGELRFTYRTRTVWFQDAESIRRKIAAVQKVIPNVAGFSYWRAGGEDPRKWELVAETRGMQRRRVVRSNALTEIPGWVWMVGAAAMMAAGYFAEALLRKSSSAR
jgi:spore germination protein